MSELIVVGNGKLAEAIQGEISNFLDIPVRNYRPDISAGHDAIFVHVGSGREYRESLSHAIRSGSSYIQAATEKGVKMEPPAGGKIKYITAPNLDINIIKLFYWLGTARDLFQCESIAILESHQSEKKSKPGTALKFCKYLNVPEESLVSIRDPDQQRKLNIRNLSQHAFHRIEIGDENSKITIETRIEGATSYVKGLARIINCVPGLGNGNYEIEDLIELNLL